MALYRYRCLSGPHAARRCGAGCDRRDDREGDGGRSMILVCGGLADIMTELVCARIESLGYPYRLLDLGHYPTGYTVDWRWEGDVPSGRIAGPEWSLDLDEISGVYVRY